MAENFGVQGRGVFLRRGGSHSPMAIQNHLLQVLVNLTMEPPGAMDSDSILQCKGEGFSKAIPAIQNPIRSFAVDSNSYRKGKGRGGRFTG